MSISGLSGSNAMMQFYNIKEEAELKSYVNKLLREFDSAGTKEAKDKVAAQLKSLASSSGASLSDLGASRASDTSIFSPKLAVATPATPTAANADTIFAAPTAAAPNPTGKTDVGPSLDMSREQRMSIIKDLGSEFGIKNQADVSWINASKTNDKIKFYDKDGNAVNVDNITGQTSTGKTAIKGGNIIEIQSAKYGAVKIRIDGDGVLSGKDDKIISMGGQAAANGTVNGLNKVNENLAQATTANAVDQAVAKPVSIQEGIAKFNETGQPVWNKTECPICQGIGCKYCSGEAVKAAVTPPAQTDQAKALVNTPAVNIAAVQQPVLTNVIDQLQNPYQLSESNIRNLLAAILQALSQT